MLVAGVLLAGLLAVVGIAARAELGADGSGMAARPGLSGGAFAYVYAGLLVVGVLALPFFFYMYARETPYSRSRRRRARLAPLWLVGFAAVGMLVATRWGDELRAALEQLSFWDGGDDPTPDVVDGPRPPEPGVVQLAVASSVLVAGVGSVVAWRLARRRPRRPSLASTLSDALDEALDDVAAEADPRRAIILAYARMESALDRCGCARREAEAPLEYLARVLGELEVAPAPAATLTHLFEHAKFSNRPVDDAMKQRALVALEDVRRELRERG
jgi:hypothetical protein